MSSGNGRQAQFRTITEAYADLVAKTGSARGKAHFYAGAWAALACLHRRINEGGDALRVFDEIKAECEAEALTGIAAARARLAGRPGSNAG